MDNVLKFMDTGSIPAASSRLHSSLIASISQQAATQLKAIEDEKNVPPQVSEGLTPVA